jgi:hypothetical protein
MKTKQHDLIDPEPFSVLVGVVGIVGGIASTLAAYKMFASTSPTETRHKALALLGDANDELEYLEADLAVIGDLLVKAEITKDRRFRPEAAAFLNFHQFKRYQKVTDSLFERLRRLLKITNRLDALMPRLPDVQIGRAVAYISDARERLHRLLRDSDRSVEDALEDIITVVRQLGELIRELRHDLHG